MPATHTLPYDFVTAKAVASILTNDDIRAIAEEYEIGMAHIRLDPEGDDPTGYVAVASDIDDDGEGSGGWMMLPTFYDENLHTYETADDVEGESLGVPIDADPEEVAEAIANFLA
jgi:hypothetical protein